MKIEEDWWVVRIRLLSFSITVHSNCGTLFKLLRKEAGNIPVPNSCHFVAHFVPLANCCVFFLSFFDIMILENGSCHSFLVTLNRCNSPKAVAAFPPAPAASSLVSPASWAPSTQSPRTALCKCQAKAEELINDTNRCLVRWRNFLYGLSVDVFTFQSMQSKTFGSIVPVSFEKRIGLL